MNFRILRFSEKFSKKVYNKSNNSTNKVKNNSWFIALLIEDQQTYYP
jgi:hypothetical protein